MFNRPIRRLAFWAAGAGAILAGFVAAAPARAAQIHVGTPEASGLEEEAVRAFAAALRESFSGARHELVSADAAAVEVRGKVKREGSHYQFEITVTRGAGRERVVERAGRCGPCTQEEALQRFRLTAEALELQALREEPSDPPSGDGDKAAGAGVAAATPVLPPATALRAGRPPPQGAPPGLTGWDRPLPWVGLLASAGALAGGFMHLDHGRYGYRCPDHRPGCGADNPRFFAGAALVLMGSLTAGTSLACASYDRHDPVHRLTAWAALVTGAAVGLSGVELVRKETDTRWRSVGYGSITVGVASVLNGVGALVAAPGGAQVDVALIPGGAVIGGRF